MRFQAGALQVGSDIAEKPKQTLALLWLSASSQKLPSELTEDIYCSLTLSQLLSGWIFRLDGSAVASPKPRLAAQAAPLSCTILHMNSHLTEWKKFEGAPHRLQKVPSVAEDRSQAGPKGGGGGSRSIRVLR